MISDKLLKVRQLLERYKTARDSDSFLLSKFWASECSSPNVYYNFLELLQDDKFTSAESITRARRKVQELYPELRGDNYKKRKKELEPEVRDEMSNWR